MALRHTIVPYYLAFATSELRHQTLTRMRGEQIAALKFSLGLLTSGFRANHPLKACRICEREDLTNHGVAYWHRSHQYPTTLVCPTHREPLWFDRSKSDGAARFEWLLPDSIPARVRKRVSIKNLPVHLADLTKLATLSIEVAKFGAHQSLERARFQTTVRQRLSALDLVTQNGSIRQRALGEDYFQTCRYLSSAELLRGLPTSARAASGQVVRLLRKDAALPNPARVLTMMNWLWPSFEEFQVDYRACIEPTKAAPLEQAKESNIDPHEDSISRALSERLAAGESLSTAARNLGVSIAMAQRRIATLGQTINRRPRKLKTDAQATLRKLAVAGKSKHHIADALSVSPQTVMRFINTDIGLKEVWEKQRWNRLRDSKRSSWTAAVNRNTGRGVNAARAEQAAAYTWLYRHDREWLAESMHGFRPTVSQVGSSVDWVERDRALSRQVEGCFDGTHPAWPPASIGELFESVPELRAKYRRLDRLPRTKRTIRRLLPSWDDGGRA